MIGIYWQVKLPPGYVHAQKPNNSKNICTVVQLFAIKKNLALSVLLPQLRVKNNIFGFQNV